MGIVILPFLVAPRLACLLVENVRPSQRAPMGDCEGVIEGDVEPPIFLCREILRSTLFMGLCIVGARFHCKWPFVVGCILLIKHYIAPPTGQCLHGRALALITRSLFCRCEVLKMWMSKQGTKATYGNLLELFIEIGQTQCAQTLCDVLKKKCE